MAGAGIPHQVQLGLTYQFNKSWMLESSYNKGHSLTGCKNFDLKVFQVGPNFFPFEGAFFVGAGLAQTNMKAGQTDSTSKLDFSMKGNAVRAYGKFGWIWGHQDGGFWFGMDVSGFSNSCLPFEYECSFGRGSKFEGVCLGR